ncbi:MAG: hypothetical protein AAGF27_02995 [Pseudomonadota bacterium]
MHSNRIAYASILLFVATEAAAQDQPLSVIDWVTRNPEQPAITSAALPKRFEPPVSPDATAPSVTVQPLGQEAARLIGIVPSTVTGLPQSLWSGSAVSGLVAQLDEISAFRLPAAQALLFTLLLTEATAPGTDTAGADLLTLARVDALARFGAHDPAISLLDQAGITRDVPHFEAYMDLALLTGLEDTACAILTSQPHLSPSIGRRIFCAARSGDWPTAALLFDTATSLETLPPSEAAVLERFLHPEAFENEAPLTRPQTMTPLLFRLHEAVGEPFPSGTLPRSYAVADLRDLAGWKPQLEAAERLAVVGALSPNKLLALYTARQPAASGGVWDRALAVQRFDTALRSRSVDAIAKSLPSAWVAMQTVGLETSFAELFAEALTRYDLPGPAGEIATTMALLSPDYRRFAAGIDASPVEKNLAGTEVAVATALSARDAALLAGLDARNARTDLVKMARNGRMGEAILRALVLLDAGASGNHAALTQALATLRAFGLEDTVRRAALQISLLERWN